MKKYKYIQPAKIEDTSVLDVENENGAVIGTVQRVYSNRLKQLFDGVFDYRYFVQYETTRQGQVTYRTKKKIRRGKLWYECRDQHDKLFIIRYVNWRIGVPELFIEAKDKSLSMKIDKEMEGWSQFLSNDQQVARWQAMFNESEQTFTIILEIEDSAPIQEADFYISIAQATLFIGA